MLNNRGSTLKTHSMTEEAEESFLVCILLLGQFGGITGVARAKGLTVLVQKQNMQSLELRKQLKVRPERKRNRPSRLLALFNVIDAID